MVNASNRHQITALHRKRPIKVVFFFVEAGDMACGATDDLLGDDVGVWQHVHQSHTIMMYTAYSFIM